MYLGPNPYGDTLNRYNANVDEKEPRRGGKNEYTLNEQLQIIMQLALVTRNMDESQR